MQRDTLGAVNLTLQMAPAEFDPKFQVLDIDTSYNLLLGRPFIHMVGAVSSTLHQMMKLVWKNEELVIHSERRHSGKQVPGFDEAPQGSDFYTVELVNATDEGLAPQTPMPAVYRMTCRTSSNQVSDWEEMPKGSSSQFQSLLKDPNMLWGTSPQMTM